MTYLDMTFCVAADNCKTALQGNCHRYFDDDHKANATLWAKSFGMEHPRVAWSDYSKSCDAYIPVNPKWKHDWNHND